MAKKKSPSFANGSIAIKLFVFFVIFIAAFIFWFSSNPIDRAAELETIPLTLTPSKQNQTIALDIPKRNNLDIKSTTDLPDDNNNLSISSIIIKQGDSLSAVFKKQGINASVLYKIMTETKDSKLLKSIRRGEKFEFMTNDKKALIQLNYLPDITRSYHFIRNNDNKFSSSMSTNPLEAIPVYREGVIESSLFLAAANNDIPDNVIMNMAGIFGWDIDFALDIRKGDHFKLIYNELYQEGVRIKTGQILAAEFTNQNKTFQAVLYTDPKGNSNYYSPNGKSMRKAFLRNPVKFSRISSRFTTRRWHPVLSKWRSHKGVDYAAPRGTPIRAAGDGKVLKKAVSRSYGNVIFLQHRSKYTTVYAHMSHFAKGMRKGKKVKQGQIIGYIGSTGYATGPHLHFEFRVHGVHRNPLTVKLPAAEPINNKYKAAFDIDKNKLLSMLKLMGHQQ